MKNFFKKVRDSIYNPGFYREIQTVDRKTAFRYFLKLNLLVSLIIVVILSFFIVPSFVVLTQSANVGEIVGLFPGDLVVTIKDGQASSNMKDAYSIAIPQKYLDENSDKRHVDNIKFTNLVTIDTVRNFDLETLKDSNSLAYLSKDYFAFQDERGQIKIQPLKGVGDVTISQDNIRAFINKSLPYMKVFIPFAILGAFAGVLIFSTICNLIFVLIMSLVIMLFFKIKKKPLAYGEIYKTGLYLVTSVILLNLIVLLLFGFGSPWYVEAILFVWLYYINLKSSSN